MASRRLLICLLLTVALAAGAGCSETQPKLPPGSGCTQNSECASNLCEAGACIDVNNPDPDGGLPDPDGGLSDAGEQPPACLQPGVECDPGASPGCCTGLCFSRNGAKPTCGDKPVCEVFGGACETADDCCSRTCLSTKKCGEQCKAVGVACTSSSDCCSAICNGTCQQVPGTTPGKKTLGEPCTQSSECAAANCQAGFCAMSSWCRASGDICISDLDCCSGDCSATGATPGVCIKPAASGTGGCIQGGEPCQTNDTCCSHLCLDLGTGAKACVLASGCRQTGENCTATPDCCGSTILNSPGECRVSSGSTIGYCSKAGGNEEIGGCCNPGTTTGSSCRNYNSCEGQVSPMQTCHQDLTGAWRCFGGGGPGGVDDPTKCPIGFDGANPDCCIAPGDSCWFRDQCCNFLPCLSDGVGGFKCTEQQCVKAGVGCDPAATGAGACCNGLRCAPSGEIGTYVCRTATTPPDAGTPGGSDGGTSGGSDGGTTGGSDGGTTGGSDAGPTCKSNGAGCAAAAECCSGTCLSGATRVCGTCKVDSTPENPIACGANGDCCSGVCLNGYCRAPITCVNTGGTCTGTSECCSGLSCVIPTGQLNGSCQVANTCSGPGQGCSTGQACCSGLRCLNPANTTCGAADSQCTCKFGIN